MSTILLIIAGWLGADALLTVGYVGKTVKITSASAIFSVMTRAFFVTILVIAAVSGVTP